MQLTLQQPRPLPFSERRASFAADHLLCLLHSPSTEQVQPLINSQSHENPAVVRHYIAVPATTLTLGSLISIFRIVPRQPLPCPAAAASLRRQVHAAHDHRGVLHYCAAYDRGAPRTQYRITRSKQCVRRCETRCLQDCETNSLLALCNAVPIAVHCISAVT
jgi:hypothetical protein